MAGIKLELAYRSLVEKVYRYGEYRHTRNGTTKGIFGEYLKIENVGTEFPILSTRKMYPKGVIGEFAAMIRQPKHLKDFEKQGCNYWKLWAKDDGSINVDYGNAWCNWNNEGINQIQQVIDTIKTNPMDRRLLVTGWNPSNLDKLDLPCCHYAYQFYVREDEYLDIYWHQRSVDVMIGLPSDIIFAAVWLIALAKEVGLNPGNIYMSLGDTHIYYEHLVGVEEYLSRPISNNKVFWVYDNAGSFWDFKPEHLKLVGYKPQDPIKFKLKE